MSWIEVPVDDVLLTHDSGVWGPEDIDAGVSVLRSTNMENDGSIDFSKLAMRAIPQSKRRDKLLMPGDTLLENSGGGPKQPVGRVCYFAGDTREHVAGNFCRRLRPNRDVVLPKFLFWNLFYLHATGGTERFQTQTTGIRNLQFRLYAAQRLPLPPLSEQRRIVEILDQADALRKLRRAADAKVARILPALFLKMFGDPATNLMGWPMTTLGELADAGPEYGANASAAPMESGKPRYIRITDIHDDGSLDGESVSLNATSWQQYLLAPGDVLFARSGNTVGKAYRYRESDGPCAYAGYLIRFRFSVTDGDPWFVFGLTRTSYYRHWVASHKRIAGQPNINGREYSSLPIPKPPKLMRTQFAAIATSTEDTLQRRVIAAQRVDQAFRTLLQRAFSGQLTAKWRQVHMQELLVEMQEQARLLNLPMPESGTLAS